jgi:predicted hydrolase (HD superfamily)
MTEFMVNMHSNPDAMHMMQGNKMMMGNMMGDNGMQMMKDSMMTKNFMHGTMANPEMMQSMMGEMMKDTKPWLR